MWDVKERRISTGNSSAKSTYPIPEAPKKQSQLDAESYHKKFEAELCGKAPTKEKHREFAKQNLGNTGRKNLNCIPLSEYYPGTANLEFRSAETLCLRIAKIAAGKICLFKLVYTGSDCIVLKEFQHLPQRSFLWFKPSNTPEIFLWLHFP